MTFLRTIAAGLAASTALLATPSIAQNAAPNAAPKVERLRGTIETVTPNAFTLRTRAGTVETVTLTATTRLGALAPASLDAVKDGSFIGTAAKAGNPPVALEVLIFPEALRGSGEGHYAWDLLPDSQAGGGAVETSMTNGTASAPKQVETSMTNGTVSARKEVETSMTNGTVSARKEVETSMTNGTVSANGSGGASGARTLTVTYKGQSLVVAVPPGTPVVALEPADKAILVPGAKVFAVAARDEGGVLAARSVSVGKDGLTPPM
jgi:hypothetical protein